MGDKRLDDAGAMAEQRTQELSDPIQDMPDRADPGDDTGSGAARPRIRRGWAALAWIAGGIALYALLLKISLTQQVTSDSANNALQAWDMMHGNPSLHGWILGDVTFYTFELPLFGVIELFFGLHTIAVHVSMALIFLIVAGCAAAIAVTGSHGPSRGARAAVVVAVLAAPILTASDAWIALGLPDHFGTGVFLLVSFLLIDRAAAGRYTAPLLCAILCAGQISDVTVRYVAVPAIALVCAYQMAVERKLMTRDGANLLAALLSVPLALAIRRAMLHFGWYLMVAPNTKIAPVGHWPHNIAITWVAVRELFGAADGGARPAGSTVIFGYACLLVVAIGMLRVLWRWRTARRVEQVLLVAIAAIVALYTFSTLASPRSPHDLLPVLQCGAALAARALVPDRITARLTALAVSGLAAVAALLPLALAAAPPPVETSTPVQLSAWLSAHGLRYGLAGYWDGSAVSVQSGNQVQIGTIEVVDGRKITPYPWEADLLWFDPAKHYANFVVIDVVEGQGLGSNVERIFGQPASTHRLGTREILIYRKNLLLQVRPARLPATN